MSIEFCSDSRRLSNALALHQWHTLSIDDGSKGLEMEEPPAWDDEAKTATLVRVTKDELHPGIFHTNAHPLHVHVTAKVEDIRPNQLPQATCWCSWHPRNDLV